MNALSGGEIQSSTFEIRPEHREAFDRDGYVVYERVLTPETIATIKAALEPYLNGPHRGRNDFEGLKTRRVYGLLAKDNVFAELAIHPLALAYAESELGPTCLLSACLAICIEPGESVQPWHHDDQTINIPRPRASYGVSAFWAIDDTTETNGATEIIPGSHLWPESKQPGFLEPKHFQDRQVRNVDDDPGWRDDALKVVMPAGSVMIAKGTLWHRGGANRANSNRIVITPQYCPGWARQLENMVLSVPPDRVAQLPERARELIGYSIQPPFMGYVNGVHPKKLLQGEPR